MSLIAIVEHDALIALDIAKTLKRAGYEIVGPFGTGQEYIDSLALDKSLDLVLVDSALEGPVTGKSTAFASKITGGIPSVFITALLDSKDLFDAKSAEPLGILVKPFSESELLGTVEIALFRAGMEKRLLYSEKRYRELFDLSLSPRCIARIDGTIIEANTAFRRNFLISENLPSLPSLFEKQSAYNSVRTSILAGKSVLGQEFEMVAAKGVKLDIIAAFSPFNDAVSGQPLISAEFFDLTEARKLRDELQQAQKMDAMGRLAGGIAHDFNNILTAIIGHSEMLKLDTDPTSPSYEDIEGISRTAGRAVHLTRQLLGFSRKQAYSPKALGLSYIVRDSASILRKLAGEQIALSLMLPEADPVSLVDPVQIEQALINLVVNARDAVAGKPDARIDIVVEEKSIGKPLKVGASLLSPGTYATIEVRDNGIGIPSSLTQKIFEPFFTTKESGKGTGLGLAIVSTIAMQSRGAIGLRSEAGKGSAFTLWFPRVEGKVGEDETTSPLTANTVDSGAANLDITLDGNPTILLVDDDEALLEFLSYVLFKAGAAVIATRNAGEALLQAEKNHCDILLIDIHLPGLDGLELYARLSAREKRKSVFISGRLEANLKIPDGKQVLEKPFTPRELISAIQAELSS
ncbi:MAG: hypothetical protein CVV53_02615 [Spirochaetae bacterium HGW-Spirochaetae-9]|nr:MAG: hypothetical protein CVV53_02615 [Spirochaetae bacterium HGW-Spirochaetae-9]